MFAGCCWGSAYTESRSESYGRFSLTTSKPSSACVAVLAGRARSWSVPQGRRRSRVWPASASAPARIDSSESEEGNCRSDTEPGPSRAGR